MVRTWSRVQASIERSTGIDTVEEVDYSNRVFTHRTRVINGPRGTGTPMDRNALNQLAAELKTEIAHPAAGTDVAGLRAFLNLIRASPPKNSR